MLYRKILPLCLLILCLPILAARADGETDAAHHAGKGVEQSSQAVLAPIALVHVTTKSR